MGLFHQPDRSPLVTGAMAAVAGLFCGEIFSYYPLTLSFFLVVFIFSEALFLGGRLLTATALMVGLLSFSAYRLVSTPLSSEDLRWLADRGVVRLVAEINGPIRHTPTQVVLPMKGIARYGGQDNLTRSPLSGSFSLRVYQKKVPFEYGDHLEMVVRLRSPSQYENPGGFPYADYRERQGEGVMAGVPSIEGIKKVGEGGSILFRTLYRWREEIRQKMLTSLHGEPLALLMALILGESGYLTDPIREAFAASGTTHILSISGSHLALVALIVFGASRMALMGLPTPLLLRLSLYKIPSQWAALITAVAVTFYAMLAGGEVATLRSLTMILVYLVSIWIGKSQEMITSLSFAALLILVPDPQAVFDLSFQLSFISVLAMILTVEWWHHQFPRPQEAAPSSLQKYVLNPIHLMTVTTLGATLGTAPLTLYYFHQFGWVGLFANFAIIPFAGWILVPFGLISAVVSLFWGSAFPGASWHQFLGSFYYRLTEWFAKIPFAEIHFASPSLWMVVLFYGIMFMLLVRKISWRWGVAALAGFYLYFLGWGGIRIPPSELRVAFLDVGQGDSAVIEFPGGPVLLIDAGGGGRISLGKVALSPYLWERRIRKIDYLVATHPQMDHVGGMAHIVRKFKIGEVWTNGMAHETAFFQEFLEAVQQKGLVPRTLDRTVAPWVIGGCQLSFLNESNVFHEKDYNNHSVVIHLLCPSFGREGFSILFTGDIEKKAEKALLPLKQALASTLLKVPHHGSRGALDPAFLDAVSPQYALFSVGRRNRYGHPHPEVVAAFSAMNVKIYRTDQDGALMVRAGNEGAVIESYREKKIEKIRWGGQIVDQEWGNMKRVFNPF